jgi:hypothetical protein
MAESSTAAHTPLAKVQPLGQVTAAVAKRESPLQERKRALSLGKGFGDVASSSKKPKAGPSTEKDEGKGTVLAGDATAGTSMASSSGMVSAQADVSTSAVDKAAVAHPSSPAEG